MAVIVGHIILISTQVNTQPRRADARGGRCSACFSEVQRGRHIGRRRSARDVVAELLRAAAGAVGERTAEAAARRSCGSGCSRSAALAEQSRIAAEAARPEDAARRCRRPAASVIAGGASPEFRTITIDKGTSDGLQPDMAVIAPAGVVGRIILPTSRASKVQLLIDRNAAAGALIERARAQGVVVGTGTDRCGWITCRARRMSRPANAS